MTVSTVSVGMLQPANVHRRHVVREDVLQGAGVVSIGWAVIIRTVGVTAVVFDSHNTTIFELYLPFPTIYVLYHSF